jgi:hypothetical protein
MVGLEFVKFFGALLKGHGLTSAPDIGAASAPGAIVAGFQHL